MKQLAAVLLKFKVYLLAVLKPLGYWGLGAIALLDSSSIPVPMDVIVAGYVWSDRSRVVLYVLAAAIGSTIGGLLPFFLGRAGGELFLLKRVDRVRYEQLRDRFERQEFLALLIPSMMPPPTPWKLFVFGAGVFEMKTSGFMLAVFVGQGDSVFGAVVSDDSLWAGDGAYVLRRGAAAPGCVARGAGRRHRGAGGGWGAEAAEEAGG